MEPLKELTNFAEPTAAAAAPANGMLLTTDAVPLPRTRAGILRTLARILSKPYVHRILLQMDEPIEVRWQHPMEDTLELEDPDDSVETTLGRVELVDIPEPGDPEHLLVQALMYCSQKGHTPAFILVHDEKALKKLFNLPWSQQIPRMDGTPYRSFCGLRMLEHGAVSDDSFIILATVVEDPQLSNCRSAVRVVP